MPPELTPDEVRGATFRVAFRGVDQAEVTRYLERVAAAVEALTVERDRLASRLGEFADRDLKSEFETVGREVASVLEAARDAAEAMRDRAGADAARWRQEATDEVGGLRKDAQVDSEAIRTDAWTTGTQLLDQVQAEVGRVRSGAERDALAARGEAEREAHRLTASARREADDVVRTAKMESERLAAQARSDYDEVIAGANRQAEAAQERARALEHRRQELMSEVESVRGALATVQSELEDRRQGIGLTEIEDLPRRAVISDDAGVRMASWEEGHTVRVIHPGRPEDEEDEIDPTDANAIAEEVARMRMAEAAATETVDEISEEPKEPEEPASEEPAPQPQASEPPAPQPPAPEEPAPEPPPHPEPAPEPRSDEVTELFRRLRRPGDIAAPDPTVASSPVAPEPSAPDFNGDFDPFETRERLLLPITNGALRSVKRSLTEAQNEALEQIRVTGGTWAPDPADLDAEFRPDLVALVTGASEAGLEAATEMGAEPAGSFGGDLPASPELGAELAAAIVMALQTAGPGPRERSAAASRVFRGWRTDEAERRVRALALLSYHGAIRWALEGQERRWSWVTTGRSCPKCREAAGAAVDVPPAHRDCTCTIVAV